MDSVPFISIKAKAGCGTGLADWCQIMATHGTDSTHHLPQEISRTRSESDQLAAIAHFFDELEAKTPIKRLQKETDGNKALLDTINSLIAVVRIIAHLH